MNLPYRAVDVDENDPALACLTERQRNILRRRKHETLAAIGRTEGVTPVRIRQIEQTALYKLRGPRARRLRLEASER